MDINALLKKLSQANGISGHETEIRSIVLDEFGRYADETRTDKLGSAIALKRGSAKSKHRRRIMLASHMDEIGLMVSGLSHGFLRVSTIGGIDPRVQLGQEVIVHGRRDLPGVTSSTPPHLLKPEDRTKIISIEQLWIDVGLSDRQATRSIRIGDLVSIRREVIELQNGLLAGKAFDNRASVAAVTACLEQLSHLQHHWDVVAVATTQEEVGLIGATTAAFGVAPDVAIAIDATYGKQYGSTGNEVFPLDKGPTIGIGPNMHPHMTQRLIDTAKKIELDYQLEPMQGSSGTDGWAIQVTHAGIPTGVVSIPIRSMHTPVEVIAPKDVERTGRLLAEFVAALDEEFYKTLNE
jgi:putative aminopeptidase FrvX